MAGALLVRDIQKQSPYSARSCPRYYSVDQSRADTGPSYIRRDPHRQHPCRIGLRFVPRASHHTDIHTAVDSNKCRHVLEWVNHDSIGRAAVSSNVLPNASGASSNARRRIARSRDTSSEVSLSRWRGNTHASATGAARGTPALPAGDTLRCAQPFQPAVARIRLSKAAGYREGRSVAPAVQRQVRTARASA